MVQQSSHNHDENDEINLYDLWKVIVRRKKFIIALFLISTVSAAVISLLMPKIYRGEAILKTSYEDIMKTTDISNDVATQNITAQEIIDILGNFDNRKIEKFCPENASKITKIELSTLNNSNDTIKITVDAKEKELIRHVFSEFTEKLNGDPLIKPLIDKMKTKLENKKNELSSVLKSSELIQTKINAVIQSGNIGHLGFNPVDMEIRISDLKTQLSRTEEALSNPLGFEMINRGSVSDKPVRPKLSLNIIIAGFMSLFVGIFLAFFLEFLQKAGKSG